MHQFAVCLTKLLNYSLFLCNIWNHFNLIRLNLKHFSSLDKNKSTNHWISPPGDFSPKQKPTVEADFPACSIGWCSIFLGWKRKLWRSSFSPDLNQWVFSTCLYSSSLKHKTVQWSQCCIFLKVDMKCLNVSFIQQRQTAEIKDQFDQTEQRCSGVCSFWWVSGSDQHQPYCWMCFIYLHHHKSLQLHLDFSWHHSVWHVNFLQFSAQIHLNYT